MSQAEETETLAEMSTRPPTAVLLVHAEHADIEVELRPFHLGRFVDAQTVRKHPQQQT